MLDYSTDIVDLSQCSWSLSKDTPGTPGMFLKSRTIMNDKTVYMKLSSFNHVDGFYGHESVLELLACRIAEYCGFHHIQYHLFHGRIKIDNVEFLTPISASLEYRVRGDKRISLEAYIALNQKSHMPTEFMLASEWAQDILNMFVFDYIIYNRDRHGCNIELLYNTDRYKLVPLFDNGCCLTQPLFNSWTDKNSSYFLEDGVVNNYLGSKSLLNNLVKYCIGKVKIPMTAPDFNIMSGLKFFISEEHVQFLYDMVRTRYHHAVDILYQ